MKRGTPPSAPPRHKSFGITDSLVDAVKNMYRTVDTRSDKFQPKSEVVEEPKIEKKALPQQLVEGKKEDYDRPELAARDRKIARKSSKLRSKGSVASNTTARFKQRHAGVTVATRKGTEGQPRATGATAARGGSKRPVGGMGAVHHDLGNQPEDEFRRKWGKSKSAMRTGLRNSVEFDGENDLNEMHITVQMNAGGTTYKVLSVSADIGGRVRVGETLSDTAIDDLRDSDVSISYKKDGGGTGKMESVDLDTKNADKAIKHDCATHVVHKEHGEGQCIPGQHTLEETKKVDCEKCGGEGDIDGEECEHCNGKGFHMEGYVTHYDVMFEHGIEDNIAVEDLEIVSESHHGHMRKKKSMKEGGAPPWVKNGDNGNGNGDDDEDEDEDDKPKKKKKKKGDKDEKENGNGNGNGDDKDEDDVEEALTKFGKGMDKTLLDKEKATFKAQGTIKMRKSDSDGIHGTTVNQKDTAKIAALKAKGYVRVSEDRAPTKKSIFKEWVAMGNRKPGTEQVKDAMEAYQLAQHYLQIGNRDALFGREDRTNMKLAKQFYEQYKEMKAKGDESANDLFKNELVDQALESQTNEDTEVARTSIGTPHKIAPQYNTKTHKLIKRKGQQGLKTVAKDYKLGQDEYEAEEVQYESSDQNPNIPYPPDEAKKLADKKAANKKELANRAGKTFYQGYNDRKDKGIKSKPMDKKKFFGKTGGLQNSSYDYNKKSWMDALAEVTGQKVSQPNEVYSSMQEDVVAGIQDKEHAPEVVEYTPHAYDYNRRSWMDALGEVNRYKGRSGHRVTKPSKEGPEHIVMQMRKVDSLGDNHQGVDFGDGTKVKVSRATARKFLDKYNSSRPDEKEKLQRSAGHSAGGLHHANSDKPIEHGPGQPKPSMFKAASRREPTRRLIHPDDKN